MLGRAECISSMITDVANPAATLLHHTAAMAGYGPQLLITLKKELGTSFPQSSKAGLRGQSCGQVLPFLEFDIFYRRISNKISDQALYSSLKNKTKIRYTTRIPVSELNFIWRYFCPFFHNYSSQVFWVPSLALFLFAFSSTQFSFHFLSELVWTCGL